MSTPLPPARQSPTTWIHAHIKWIMLLSGAWTCTMFLAAIAPQAALQATFGETLPGPLAEVVVRNWGALIGLVGGLLIYGAFRPASRPLILVTAGTTKLVFVALVLAQGSRYLGQTAAVALFLDLVAVGLYAVHLLFERRRGPRPE